MKISISSRGWVAGGIAAAVLVAVASSTGIILPEDKDTILNLILGFVAGGAAGIGVSKQ